MTQTSAALLTEFAAEVARDLQLTPKQLQSKYLYDQLGSSLFEAICRLPWYRITRAESRLLCRHAAEIVDEFCGGSIVELGCGSGEKIAMLAEALQSQRYRAIRPFGHVGRVRPVGAEAEARVSALALAARIGILRHRQQPCAAAEHDRRRRLARTTRQRRASGLAYARRLPLVPHPARYLESVSGAVLDTRIALLEDVLRPAVRALSAEDVATVERRLAGTGSRAAEEFRTWNRPGAFGRFAQRFGGGRGRRGPGAP